MIVSQTVALGGVFLSVILAGITVLARRRRTELVEALGETEFRVVTASIFLGGLCGVLGTFMSAAFFAGMLNGPVLGQPVSSISFRLFTLMTVGLGSGFVVGIIGMVRRARCSSQS